MQIEYGESIKSETINGFQPTERGKNTYHINVTEFFQCLIILEMFFPQQFLAETKSAFFGKQSRLINTDLHT